jgi:hypothetical protein
MVGAVHGLDARVSRLVKPVQSGVAREQDREPGNGDRAAGGEHPDQRPGSGREQRPDGGREQWPDLHLGPC